jgi:ATP-dependent helicase Lhr and Lhr-like helicase
VNILHYIGWYTHRSSSGLYIEIVYDGDVGAAIAALRQLSPQVPELVRELVAELKDDRLWRGKYDYLVPRTLLEKAYINDFLDISGTALWLATCS